MRFVGMLYRNLRALPILAKLIGIPLAVVLILIAAKSVIAMPVWQVVVGIAGGIILYAVTDLKVPGYRFILAIGVLAMAWTLVPFIVTYIALFGVAEPGAVRVWLRARQLAPRGATPG